MASEETLLRTREHGKALVGPVLVQLLLLAAHIGLYVWAPFQSGWDVWDSWGPLILHGIVGILELVYAIVPALTWWLSSFIVTSHRVEAHWGILNRVSRDIPLDRIVSVSVERGLIDRIFGAGTLVFHDSASIAMSDPRDRRNPDIRSGVRFTDVPRVFRVKAAIDDATAALRAR